MNKLIATIGSDLDFSCVWKDDQGTPMDLTGYSLEVYKPSYNLIGCITLNYINQAKGSISGRIEWDEKFKSEMSFRIRITQGQNSMTTQEILLEYV